MLQLMCPTECADNCPPSYFHCLCGSEVSFSNYVTDNFESTMNGPGDSTKVFTEGGNLLEVNILLCLMKVKPSPSGVGDRFI